MVRGQGNGWVGWLLVYTRRHFVYTRVDVYRKLCIHKFCYVYTRDEG